jgi:uncharacterized coiled-coil DUF342 family protein
MADGNAKVDEVRREVASLKVEFSECCPKVKKDLTKLEQEFAKLKEEMTTIKAIKPKAGRLRGERRPWLFRPLRRQLPQGKTLSSRPPPKVTRVTRRRELRP